MGKKGHGISCFIKKKDIITHEKDISKLLSVFGSHKMIILKPLLCLKLSFVDPLQKNKTVFTI